MSTHITDECIGCGACEPECPNDAISEGDSKYLIDPARCSECVGFFDHEVCQSVCPVECCVPDPSNRETEDLLLRRAHTLHPDKNLPELAFLPAGLSRFRKESSGVQEGDEVPLMPAKPLRLEKSPLDLASLPATFASLRNR